MCNKSKFQFILLISRMIFQAQGLYESAFELDRNMSDKAPSGVIPVTVRSLADCGNECTSNYGCTGFHYSLLDRECFLDTSSVNHLALVENPFTEHFTVSKPDRSISSRRLSASSPVGAPVGFHSQSVDASSASEISITSLILNLPLTTPTILKSTFSGSSPASIVSYSTLKTSSALQTTSTSQQPSPKTTLSKSTASTSVSSTNAGIAIVSNSACPSRFEQDVIVEGVSGLTYRFKIIDVNETRNGAEIKCATYGMRLFKVNNNIKVQDLSKFLSGCKVYKGYQFWTDASMAMNSWKNSDSSPVPNSAWCHGTPGSKVSQRCARMSSACGFKLTDCSCQSNLVKAGLICE